MNAIWNRICIGGLFEFVWGLWVTLDIAIAPICRAVVPRGLSTSKKLKLRAIVGKKVSEWRCE